MPTEKALEEVYLLAEKDDLQEQIGSAYSNLSKTIDEAKQKELADKEAEITQQLVDELVKRYFYRDGLYEYQIKHNPEIAEAVKILKDGNGYDNLLMPKE